MRATSLPLIAVLLPVAVAADAPRAREGAAPPRPVQHEFVPIPEAVERAMLEARGRLSEQATGDER